MPPFDATPPNRKSGKKAPKDQGLIDATPGGEPLVPVNNITESKAWKSSSRGAKRFWFNYKKLLHDSFVAMTRDEQEALIEKFSVILTLGVTVLLLLAFSAVLPPQVRVLGFPVALFVAWWLGSRLIAGAVIDRLEGIMKQE